MTGTEIKFIILLKQCTDIYQEVKKQAIESIFSEQTIATQGNMFLLTSSDKRRGTRLLHRYHPQTSEPTIPK